MGLLLLRLQRLLLRCLYVLLWRLNRLLLLLLVLTLLRCWWGLGSFQVRPRRHKLMWSETGHSLLLLIDAAGGRLEAGGKRLEALGRRGDQGPPLVAVIKEAAASGCFADWAPVLLVVAIVATNASPIEQDWVAR